MNGRELHRGRQFLERIVDRLADPETADRTALALIGGYLLLWWSYAVVAKSSQDIHFDMGEVVSWSLVPSYGYPKHPPFPAWVAAAWFSVFPYADWAFYLLAVLNVAVALWFVWLIAKRYVAGAKRTLALALLTFSPGFNFQPIKFNSNALLISVWAAAAYTFLRSFEQRTLLWGAIAGLAAAIAMLTKYWSIFLIIGFVVAALSHPRRMDYLRSAAPWMSVIVGGIVLAPNVVSLVHYDFGPFAYATASHTVTSIGKLLSSFSDYLGGVLFLAGGIVAVLIACRPDAAAIRDMLLPPEPDRRMMAVATWTAFLSPFFLAVALRTELATLWTLPMWSMVPALLLSSQGLAVTRQAAAAVLAAGMIVPVVALLASPAIASVIHRNGLSNYASHYRLIAESVDKAWRQASARPMRLFGSDTNVVNGASFYLSGRPLRIDIVGPKDTPWADAARLRREGIAMVCPVDEGFCNAAMENLAHELPTGRRSEVELSRTFFGVADTPVRYVILIVPPQP